MRFSAYSMMHLMALRCVAPLAAMVDLIQELVGQAAVEVTTSTSLDATASWEAEGEALASATTDPETASVDIVGEVNRACAEPSPCTLTTNGASRTMCAEPFL